LSKGFTSGFFAAKSAKNACRPIVVQNRHKINLKNRNFSEFHSIHIKISQVSVNLWNLRLSHPGRIPNIADNIAVTAKKARHFKEKPAANSCRVVIDIWTVL